MSLKRKNIRAAIVAALVNGTDADDRVYPSRVRPVWQPELPVILVYTRSEAVTLFAESGPREYQRTLSVSVEILMEANDGVDDELDTVGEQVEFFLNIDHTLGELCHDVILIGSDITVDKTGDNTYGSLVMNYDVIYHTEPVNDPADLEWLNRVEVEYNLEETPSGDNAIDTLIGLSSL